MDSEGGIDPFAKQLEELSDVLHDNLIFKVKFDKTAFDKDRP